MEFFEGEILAISEIFKFCMKSSLSAKTVQAQILSVTMKCIN